MSNTKRLDVSILRVLLLDVKACRNQDWKGRETSIRAKVEPSLKTNDEEESVVEFEVCCLVEGDDSTSSPFNIEAKYLYRVRCESGENGNELIERFNEISFPIASEFGLLVGQITKAMGHVPLLLPALKAED